MTAVFGTVPEGPLADLVAWIAGDDIEDTPRSLVAELLPQPEEVDFVGTPWLRRTWNSGDSCRRTVVRLWLVDRTGWPDPPEGEGQEACFRALKAWAWNYAVCLRQTLYQPATEVQIADALSNLADVLNQDVAERMAAFIIEVFIKAKLPPYLVNELFERVALTETGKLKPASFTRLRQTMEERLEKTRGMGGGGAWEFCRHFEEALAYLREHPDGEGETTPVGVLSFTHEAGAAGQPPEAANGTSAPPTRGQNVPALPP